MAKSTRTHDVTATIGEYTNSQGETKKRYVNCGSAFTDEQGRVSIKLDSVPVSPEWSGWLSLYPVKEREERGGNRGNAQQRPAQSRSHQAAQKQGWDEFDKEEDSQIPF